MHIFYQPDLSYETILLSEEESKHAVRVLRLNSGDSVELVDGKGTRASAEVIDDHPKRCTLKILARTIEKPKRNFHLHIAVAPTKNIDRIEWFVEKATEIGVDEISLIDCEHSERTTVKVDRLEKVAVSAMKQSQQSWLPVIHEIRTFADFTSGAEAELKLIAHCDEGAKNPIHTCLTSTPLGLTSISRILVLIGPEGDFSPTEITTATQNGFTPVSLGETRLRTETAALYAVVAANINS